MSTYCIPALYYLDMCCFIDFVVKNFIGFKGAIFIFIFIAIIVSSSCSSSNSEKKKALLWQNLIVVTFWMTSICHDEVTVLMLRES